MSFKHRLATNIIKKAQKGDKLALTHIYHQYKAAIFSLALRIIQDRDAAEDIVQQVIEKMLTKIVDLNDARKFNGWLKTLTYRTTIDYVNKNANQVSLEEIEDIIDVTNLNVASLDIEKYLNRLNPKERLVLTLFLVEGYKHQEIAEKLNMTETNSKQVYRRSLNKLKMLEAKMSFGGG